MRTNVYYGGAESLESRVPGMDCGGLGFAFDLQRFADNDVVLVVKDGDKVTLNLNTEWQGNDRWLLLPNGAPINLSALRSSNTKLNVKDSAGHTYGTMDAWARVTLSSPEEGAAPINEVSAQGSVEILNGNYLAEKTKCSHVRVEQFDVLKVLKDDDQNGASVSVAQNSDAVAEMVYHRDGYLVSGKNGIVVINGTYAVLPGDTYVEHKEVMPCELLADSEGKLTVRAGNFFANGAISLSVVSNTELRDEAGIRLAVFNTPVYKNGAMVVEEFKGIYDGANKKISPTQGSFSVFGEDGGVYCCVVNDKDETMELWETDVYGNPTGLVTRRAYAEIDKVSFTLTEDVSSLSGDNDYGLTLDIKTVTVTATDTLSLIEPPEGMDTVIYQNEDGSTRYATLKKTETGYELAVENEAVTVNRDALGDAAALTLTKGAVTLAWGSSIIVAGTEYTAWEGGATLALAEQDGGEQDIAVLTAGAVTLDYDGSKGESIYAAGKQYTAAGYNTVIELLKEDDKEIVSLSDGTVTLEKGAAICIAGVDYTAAADGTTLEAGDGFVYMSSGAVSMPQGGVVEKNGTLYTAVAGGADLTFVPGTYQAEVVLKGQGILQIGDRTYTAGTADAVFTFDYEKISVAEGEVTVAVTAGNEIWVVSKEGNTVIYEAGASGASFTCTGSGVKLAAGDVALGNYQTISVGETAYTAIGKATLSFDKEGAVLTAGRVKFATGSLLVKSGEKSSKYTVYGTEQVEMYLDKDGAGVLSSGAVWFARGTSVRLFNGKEYTAAGEGAALSDSAFLQKGTISLSGDSRVYVGNSAWYRTQENGSATLAFVSETEAELVSGEVVLYGSFTNPAPKIKVGTQEYTGVNGTTLALVGGSLTLKGGTVSLTSGESIVINDTVYEAVTGTATLTMVQDSPAQTRVELTGEASLTIDGRQYDAGSQGADFIFDSSDSNITFNSGEASVVLGAEEEILANGSRYAATDGKATLNLAKDKVQLVSGEVKLFKDGTSIYAGQGEYKSVEGYTTVTVDAEKQAVLTYGSVEFVEDSSLSVAGKVYNAKAGTILRLDEPPEGKEIAVLYSGAVALQTGQSIHTPSSHTYTAREGGAVFTYTPDHDGIDEALELREGTLHFDGSIAVKAGGRDYYVAENGTVLACAGAYGQEQTVSLKAGGVYFADGVSIEVGDTTYKAPQEAGVRLSVNEDGKAELADDSVVQFDKGSLVIGGVEYVNSSDSQEAVMSGGGTSGAAELKKGEVTAELPAGKEVSANGKKYKAEGGAVLTLEAQEDQEVQADVKLSGKASVTVDGKAYTAGAAGADLDCTGREAELVSGEVVLGENETIIVDGKTITASEAGTILSHEDEKTELTAGEVSLPDGESIWAGGHKYTAQGGAELAMDKDGVQVGLEDGHSVQLDDGRKYTAGEAGATLEMADGKARLVDGAVVLDQNESIFAGGAEYTALEGKSPITLNENGQVTLAENTSTYVSTVGTIIIIKGGCEVNSDGSLTGMTDGTSLVLEQDGVEYEMEVSGGEVNVTKDGVTKTAPLDETTGIDEDMLAELYPPDLNQPQSFRAVPGKEKVLDSYDPAKDVVKMSNVNGEIDPDKLILTKDGQLTYGDSFADGLAANGAMDFSEAEHGDFYEAVLTDKNGGHKQLVAWSGSDSAVVDMRSEEKGVIMKDGGNNERDVFLGGKGRDAITLGSEDIARGGEGRDLIVIEAGAKGAEAALQDGGGHDEVQGFGFGFDDDASIVNLEDTSGLASLSVDGIGRLKTEGSTLEFVGKDLKNSNQTDLLMRDADGLHKVSMGRKMAQMGDETADIYYGTSQNAELDFGSLFTDALTIDLNNNWEGTDAAVYGVKKVTGADGAENTLIGQDGKNNTLVGGTRGANSLYGGMGGNDKLIGSGSSEDSFYFGLDSGKDTIENFGEEDTLAFLDGNYAGAQLGSDGHLKLKWSDGHGHTASLTLNEDIRDKVITYDFGDGAHGAKFGSKLTIDDDTADFVNYYNSGGTKGELDLSGKDDKSIWLDGSQGVAYEGFRKVDASAMAGDVLLAGGERSEELIAGKGESSLWGGAGNTNDTMIGGRGENEFYFGKGEGKDLITSSNNDDKVMLYNVTLADIDGSKTGVKDGRMVIALTDGSTLTIENYKSHGAETFHLADSTWTYDKKTGDWTQVK